MVLLCFLSFTIALSATFAACQSNCVCHLESAESEEMLNVATHLPVTAHREIPPMDFLVVEDSRGKFASTKMIRL